MCFTISPKCGPSLGMFHLLIYCMLYTCPEGRPHTSENLPTAAGEANLNTVILATATIYSTINLNFFFSSLATVKSVYRALNDLESWYNVTIGVVRLINVSLIRSTPQAKHSTPWWESPTSPVRVHWLLPLPGDLWTSSLARSLFPSAKSCYHSCLPHLQ